MLLGWGVNSAMGAVRHARGILSALLIYLGANLILIEITYNIRAEPQALRMISKLAGTFSFTPLEVALHAVLDFNIPHEMYIAAAIFAICLAGWAAGVVYARFHPDPYRPRMMKQG
jgi:hypothetical protein